MTHFFFTNYWIISVSIGRTQYPYKLKGRLWKDELSHQFFSIRKEANKMGTFVSKTMEENVRKNQEFMMEMNRITVSWISYCSPMGKTNETELFKV